MAKFVVANVAEFNERIDNAGSALVVVHFSAAWAPQCRQMEVVTDELTKDASLAGVVFLQVEAESVAEISEAYGVTAVPAFVLLRGRQRLETVNGANAPELTRLVRRHAGAPPPPTLPTKINEENLTARLKRLIGTAPCMLFMKGTPREPKCGFSRQIVDILDGLNTDYGSFDILADDQVRQGLKEFSKWPTYPQLYAKGEFLGGLDIVKELNESGELEGMLPKKQSLEERLKSLVAKANVMVFMKGTPQSPRCGFSKQLVAILGDTGVPYESFDILEDDEVRQGLKAYSKWPTYPQVYVKGELVGGLDIVKELKEAGELTSTLRQ